MFLSKLDALVLSHYNTLKATDKAWQNILLFSVGFAAFFYSSSMLAFISAIIFIFFLLRKLLNIQQFGFCFFDERLFFLLGKNYFLED